MRELVLLVEPFREPSAPSPEQVIVHWSAWDVAEGRISLPARLHADLLSIRAEHMAWAYELGRLPVGRKETQARLKAGANLSMWWCSLLYERHPKMTPSLHTIYKLRALERLMDERGFTALRLCGGDGVLRHTLADFCAASGRLFVEFHEPGLRMARKVRCGVCTTPAPRPCARRFVTRTGGGACGADCPACAGVRTACPRRPRAGRPPPLPPIFPMWTCRPPLKAVSAPVTGKRCTTP